MIFVFVFTVLQCKFLWFRVHGGLKAEGQVWEFEEIVGILGYWV
jgi:hypothetical protein